MRLFVEFDDVRDAAQAKDQVYDVAGVTETNYVAQQEYAAVLNQTMERDEIKPGSTNFYGSQVMFIAELIDLSHPGKIDLEAEVSKLAASYGSILALKNEGMLNNKARFRVEYCSYSNAEEAISKATLNAKKMVGVSTRSLSSRYRQCD